MTRFQPWIVIIPFFAFAAATWLFFAKVHHSGLQQEKITQASKPSNQSPTLSPAAKTLHIEGCDTDFPVKPGEQIEPQVVPGVTVEKIRSIYGKESKKDELGVLTWNLDGYSLSDDLSKTHVEQGTVSLFPNHGQILTTTDGIELGKDTFATLLQKTKARGIPIHESMDGPEGSWMLLVWFPSMCNSKFRSVYTWIIRGSQTVDEQILPAVKDGGAPWRSNVFLDEKVQYFSMEPAHEPAEELNYHPSVHQ
jgi:hypothetical protein